MSASRAVCLLVLLSVALTHARVELDELVRDTQRIESDLDLILERTKVNPLAKIHEGPMAPHAATVAEWALERPIQVLREKAAAKKDKKVKSASKSSETGKVALVETSETVNVGLQNGQEALLRSAEDPSMNRPEPKDAPFYAARKEFHATKPTDIELRLRKLWPKPVVVTPPAIEKAEILMNADEILPKDPGADKMLNDFNSKYGLFDDSGIPSDPYPPNSELLPPDRRNFTATMREYASVFDAANKFGFDPEKDSIAELDKALAAMWSKRWEYFASEKSSAEAHEKARKAKNQVKSYPIDPLFPRRQRNVDDRGESLLGDVYTFVDKVGNPIPSIPTRDHFKQETSFYGPAVFGNAQNTEDLKPPAAAPEFVYPHYNGPDIPRRESIKLIPEVPAVVDNSGTVAPQIKGLDFAAESAKPAIILSPFPKLKVDNVA